MSFNNFKQADARVAEGMDYDNHKKRLEKELREIIRFFEEEDIGLMLHIIRIKKLDIGAIKNFIKEVQKMRA